MKATTMSVLFGTGLCLLFPVISCNREESARTQERSLSLCLETVSRSTLDSDGKSVKWEDGDAFCFITYNASESAWGRILNVKPDSWTSSSAQFTVELPEGADVRYVSFPSRSTQRYDEERGGIRTKVDSPVYLIKDGMPRKSVGSSSTANTSIGVVEGNSVLMRNVCALLRFELTSSEIVRAELSSNGGEALSGYPYIDPKTLSVTGWDSALSSITLQPVDAAFEPGVYYLPIIPQVFASGLTLVFTNASGNILQHGFRGRWMPERNVLYDMGRESDWKDGWSQAISLSFTKADTWPFAQTIPTQSEVEAAAAAGTELGPFYQSVSPAQEFYLYVQRYRSASSMRVTAGGGFRFGGTVGDYLRVPGIAGYRLARISGQTANYSFPVKVVSPSGAVIAGGAEQSLAAASPFSFNLSGNAVGEGCRIQLTGDNMTSFQQLAIVYATD